MVVTFSVETPFPNELGHVVPVALSSQAWVLEEELKHEYEWRMREREREREREAKRREANYCKEGPWIAVPSNPVDDKPGHNTRSSNQKSKIKAWWEY